MINITRVSKNTAVSKEYRQVAVGECFIFPGTETLMMKLDELWHVSLLTGKQFDSNHVQKERVYMAKVDVTWELQTE